MKNLAGISQGLMGLFLAIGIALSGYFVSQLLLNANQDTAEAKGLSERRVDATQAIWKINYGGWMEEGKSKIQDLFKEVEKDQHAIINALTDIGITEEEILVGSLDHDVKEYRNDDNVLMESRRYLSGQITVDTKNVHLIPKARAKLNDLIANGVSLENLEPRYLFTELNAIKPEMLKEATANAKVAATEFAKAANVKVGGIETARQGNFMINDANEEYTTSTKIEKDVRVVTTIKFYLTN